LWFHCLNILMAIDSGLFYQYWDSCASNRTPIKYLWVFLSNKVFHFCFYNLYQNSIVNWLKKPLDFLNILLHWSSLHILVDFQIYRYIQVIHFEKKTRHTCHSLYPQHGRFLLFITASLTSSVAYPAYKTIMDSEFKPSHPHIISILFRESKLR
jgi:hypothetical protein